MPPTRYELPPGSGLSVPSGAAGPPRSALATLRSFAPGGHGDALRPGADFAFFNAEAAKPTLAAVTSTPTAFPLNVDLTVSEMPTVDVPGNE